MESKVWRPVMRSLPMTTGYSRPSSAFTFCRAVSMADLFSGLLKSVSGSFVNSLNFDDVWGAMGRILRRRGCSAVGMYSKSASIATALASLGAALVLSGCSSILPWRHEPIGEEVNVVFALEKNLVVLPSATIDGSPGRFVFGSAEPRTLLDPAFARKLP